MQVTVYSTTTCPYCKMLKDYLAENGVDYLEKLVDQDDEAREEMLKESGGFLGVPFIVVSREGGAKESVVGFDKGRLGELLNIKA